MHSEDDPLVIEADEETPITDIDVSSYYPGLVVEERIAPSHLDADIFCGVFADLMRRRLEAKAKKQKEIAQGHEDQHQQRCMASCRIATRRSAIRRKARRSRINGQLILLRLIEEPDSDRGRAGY